MNNALYLIENFNLQLNIKSDITRETSYCVDLESCLTKFSMLLFVTLHELSDDILSTYFPPFCFQVNLENKKRI